MAGAFNLFHLLELDPADRWDATVFEQRLKQKQNEWARLTNHPKKALEAKRCIALIPQLRDVAGNATLRATHAKEAASGREAEHAELAKQFDDELNILQLKGHLLNGELADLAKKFPQLGTAAQLRSRVRVPIVENVSAGTATPREGLDPSVARKIDADLSALRKRDLYDFLELDASAPIPKLLQRAEEIYKRAQVSANKDTDTTLKAQLAGACRAYLNSPQNKARYDATLENARFDRLRYTVELAASATKTLPAAVVEALLKEFRKAGGNNTDVDSALEVLRAHAKKKGYALEIPQGAVEKLKTTRRCGYCDTINEAALKHCVHCGKPLEEACPKCTKVVPTEQGACGACGFPCGNRRYVDVLCQEARSACTDNNFELAGERCEQAAADWPGAHGLLAERIASLRKQIAAGRAAQAKYAEALRQDIRERRFFRAQERLREDSGLFPAHSSHLAPERLAVQTAISEAARALQRARELTGSDVQKVDVYSQVLAIAADCQEARDALAAFPPDPPAGLEAVVEGGQVRLSWRNAATRGVSCLVMRKAHARPVSDGAGDVLATTQGNSWQDASPEIGVLLYYSVVTERGGVRSRGAALLAKPVIVLEEIGELRADVGDGHVTLTWRRPSAVSRVVVRRGQGSAPQSVSEGVEVSVTPNGSGAADRGLTNGQRYHYAIFAQFDAPAAGGLLTTSGVRIAVTPEEPPLPIEELIVTAEGDTASRRVQLSWSAPARGHVLVFVDDRSFKINSGERRLSTDLKAFGSPLSGGGERVAELLMGQRARYYLPVTVSNDLAVIGREQVYRNVEECGNLTCQSVGTGLRLKWTWPSGCSQVRVGHGPEKFVTEREAAVVTLAQYQARGYLDIPNPAHADQFIVVFADYEMPDGTTFSSAGCRKRVRVGSRVTVRYEISKGLFGGPLKLKVDVVGEGTVPPMVMVRRARVLPMSRSEGEPVMRIEPIPPDTRRLVLPIPSTACAQNTFGQLFMEDDGDYDLVTLQKPALERLRLF